ncbi:hypothetical protein M9H77_16648 [Catharanthus roseus]|uniref:Uncharacterized protein n=1 Tax=Catharanthus roseus TaxID=4058 RepID=A0ACC0B2C6_CATRO|nr:hypothetical protein M9H77_16648 [Catharanthus roseus]
MFATGEYGRGLRTIRFVCPSVSAEGTAKYQELTMNAERLHTETSSCILTDEQLMFEAAGGNDKGHVYGFGSQSDTITMEHQEGNSSSSSVPFLWGYMQQAQDKFADFMTSFAFQCGMQLDSIPILFPPFLLPDDDATSQPPIGPPSSSSSHPPT